MKTESLNLGKNMVALLEKNGITVATPIQKKIIPAILAGRDILAQSETGSGKTISFAVPLIEKIQSADNLCALVLVPTRELCTQVADEFKKFSAGKRLGITAVYGGVSIENQVRKIKKTNIIVATPGRLIDLINRKSVSLLKIKYLVFDEADRMLDMGFKPDIEKILKHISGKVQTMLFSATVSKEITELSKKYLENPVQVILESTVDPGFLHQTYYQTTQEKKLPLLIHLLKKERDLSLVFCNRKHITARIAAKLTAYGVQAKCLHGDMSQSQRERVTADFKNKKFKILIATDVASRGLHIEDISHVYNYEIPKDVDSYTHRIGRTARAGKKGEAISLVTSGEEQKFFKQILFNYRGVIQLKTTDIKELEYTEKISTGPDRGKQKSRFKDKKSGGKNRNKSFDRKKKADKVLPDKEKNQKWKDTLSLILSESKSKEIFKKEKKNSYYKKDGNKNQDERKFGSKRKKKPGFFGKMKSKFRKKFK